jgi:hypothetical protein
MSEDEEGEGTDLWDDIVVELEYDPSRFFTCDVDVEEYVSGISDHASYVQGIGGGDRETRRRRGMDIRENLLLNLFLLIFEFAHCLSIVDV